MVFDVRSLVVPDSHLCLAVVPADSCPDSVHVVLVVVDIVDIGQRDHVYTALPVVESDTRKREAVARRIVADMDAAQMTVAVAASLFWEDMRVYLAVHHKAVVVLVEVAEADSPPASDTSLAADSWDAKDRLDCTARRTKVPNHSVDPAHSFDTAVVPFAHENLTVVHIVMKALRTSCTVSRLLHWVCLASLVVEAVAGRTDVW